MLFCVTELFFPLRTALPSGYGWHHVACTKAAAQRCHTLHQRCQKGSPLAPALGPCKVRIGPTHTLHLTIFLLHSFGGSTTPGMLEEAQENFFNMVFVCVGRVTTIT